MGHCSSKHNQSIASRNVLDSSLLQPNHRIMKTDPTTMKQSEQRSSKRVAAQLQRTNGDGDNKQPRLLVAAYDADEYRQLHGSLARTADLSYRSELAAVSSSASSSSSSSSSSLSSRSSSSGSSEASFESVEFGSQWSLASTSTSTTAPSQRQQQHQQPIRIKLSRSSNPAPSPLVSFDSSRHIIRTQNPNHFKEPRKDDIFSTYSIHPTIKGHGIAGQVRSATHIPTSTPCAVKTITKSRIRRKDRIAREIAFLSQVHHPNIIQLYDVYEDDQRVHIVTELCEGGELFDRIVNKALASKKRKLMLKSSSKKMIGTKMRNEDGNVSQQQQQPTTCYGEHEAAQIISSVLSAVSYLHSQNIIHRDIKPENILFTKKEKQQDEDNDDDDNSTASSQQIKLIDFGLSIRHPQGYPPLTNCVGTSYYMAPEVLDGSYNKSCDLWSIGVLTYIMLSGRPPFNGSTDDVIFDKIRKGMYKLEDCCVWDEEVSDVAKDFIRCLLVPDVSKRWNAEMAMEHAWLKMNSVKAGKECFAADFAEI